VQRTLVGFIPVTLAIDARLSSMRGVIRGGAAGSPTALWAGVAQGTEPAMAACRHAVTDKYRFYSYGDAMYVENAARAGSTQQPRGRT